MLTSTYTLSATTALPFDAAVRRVRDELTAEGFGVLCENRRPGSPGPRRVERAATSVIESSRWAGRPLK